MDWARHCFQMWVFLVILFYWKVGPQAAMPVFCNIIFVRWTVLCFPEKKSDCIFFKCVSSPHCWEENLLNTKAASNLTLYTFSGACKRRTYLSFFTHSLELLLGICQYVTNSIPPSPLLFYCWDINKLWKDCIIDEEVVHCSVMVQKLSVNVYLCVTHWDICYPAKC